MARDLYSNLSSNIANRYQCITTLERNFQNKVSGILQALHCNLQAFKTSDGYINVGAGSNTLFKRFCKVSSTIEYLCL